jgi:hypothetical protein
MSSLQPPDAQEAALRAFLAPLDAARGVRLRSLSHAWTAAGGSLHVGKLSIRLQSGAPAYTAATLYANQGGHAALELAKVQLQARGIDAQAWQAWCDERVELRAHGFAPDAKYTTIRLDGLGPSEFMRLVEGLRDLGLLLKKS